MAKKSRRVKTEKLKKVKVKDATILREEHLEDKADAEYYAYGVHVIEDRAIYGEIDGLKPVMRRTLWAAHKLGLTHKANHVKAALVVGKTMGEYHPHGDTSIYGAMVTAVHQPIGTIQGLGNWGTMTDNPAAMRYTNCRLSKYADLAFFNKFYLPVADMVPNYDGNRQEPLILPTLLPNALLNGNFGIAPGVRTQTPTFTLKSMIPVIIEALREGKATPLHCRKLEFTTEYGAVMRKTDETKLELKQFWKTGRGRFLFDSQFKEISKHQIRFDCFAPFANIENVIAKVETFTGVKSTRNDSDKKDRYKVAYSIFFAKTVDGKFREQLIEKIMDAFSANVNFNMQVTERHMSEDKPGGDKKLRPTNVPDLIDTWIKYRVGLEKTACQYWIGERKKDIAYLELMILAVKSRSFIIKALDKKLNDQELALYIAKGLKITVDQANTILDLKVRQLKRLEENDLREKIKVIKSEIAGYKERIKHPKTYIAKQMIRFKKELIE